MNDLRGVDLNLLVALQVLLEECHVTRSAERLGISQPAMSGTLARLRALFGDALLVRGSKGLTRTPRGESLREQLDRVLAHVGEMIALPSEFDPATSRRTFGLIGTDFVEYILLPALMTALSREAPRVQVHFRAPDFENIEPMMARGEIDLAMGYCPAAPEVLIHKALFRETFVCIARRDHPALEGGTLTLERYLEWPHVQVLPLGSAMYASDVDATLASMGLVRKIALWQPSFLAIPSVVAHSDLMSTVPLRVATNAAGHLPLTLYEVPFALPVTDFALYWHPRHQEDAGHRWLRQRIAALLRS